MIEPAVQQLASAFRGQWNQYLAVAPCLELDNSVPSIGVLDLLTFPLRLKAILRPEHEKGLRGASAYLATIIEKCWSPVFDDVTVTLSAQGVQLRALSDKHAADGEVFVPVEEILRKLLHELPSPVPLSGEWERPIAFDSNVVSLVGISLLAGVHPEIEGAWAGKTVRQLEPVTEEVMREVAKQYAEYYARVFPQEPLGQVGELYLRGILFPPILADEALPASRAVDGVLEFVREYKVSKSGLRHLAHNFVMTPDDTLSTVGAVIAMALAEQLPPANVICSIQTKGKFLGVLRHSSERLRSILNLGEDWIASGLTTPAAKQRFRLDEVLGSIPWLSLSMARIEEETAGSKLLAMVRAMSEFQFDLAIRLCSELLEEDPSDIELRIQRIRFTMVSGDYEQAESLFRALLSEPGADASPRFFSLWGLCALELKQHEKARSYFNAARAVIDSDPTLKPELENNLGWAAILAADSLAALEHLERASLESAAPVTALLNRAHVLWTVGEHAHAASLRSTLFALAPTDRRVFAGLTAKSLD